MAGLVPSHPDEDGTSCPTIGMPGTRPGMTWKIQRTPWLKSAYRRSGESVTEATIGRWFKKPGDAVAVDEPLVELETDKVTIEVPAPAAGVLARLRPPTAITVAVGPRLGEINDGAASRGRAPAANRAAKTAAQRPRRPRRSLRVAASTGERPCPAEDMPLRRRCGGCRGVRRRAHDRAGTGKDGRVTKGDMLAAHRACGRRADTGGATRRRRSSFARLRRPTMPRAKSACG